MESYGVYCWTAATEFSAGEKALKLETNKCDKAFYLPTPHCKDQAMSTIFKTKVGRNIRANLAVFSLRLRLRPSAYLLQHLLTVVFKWQKLRCKMAK